MTRNWPRSSGTRYLVPTGQGVTIQSECPIGLIGDDIEAVAKKSAKEISKPVGTGALRRFPGCFAILGHHVANDSLRDWVLHNRDEQEGFESTPYDVAITGDYNIGGDAWSSRVLLEEMACG